MRKPIYICLPYGDVEFTMVYAGNDRPQTDGDIIEVSFDPDGWPGNIRLVQSHGQQVQ